MSATTAATGPRAAAKGSWRRIAARGIVAVELGVILAVGLRFVHPFLRFDDSIAPGGHEFEGNAGWLGVARDALLTYRELPLWNHYLGTGLPYLADPFSHLFSPLALIPGLVLGAADGPRLAVTLTIVAAGLGQYYLARVLGLSAAARVIASLVYMMNGQMMARFEFGHYDFGLAYPYLPLSYALLIQTLRTARGVVYPMLAGLSVAGLLFAGNVYYFVFTLPGLGLTAAFYLVEDRRSLSFLAGKVWRAATAGLWSLGFSAIQWAPWFASRDLISKDPDPFLKGSPTVLGSLKTLFTSDRTYYTTDAGGMTAGLIHEYYAYIGALLIPLFILSPLALLAGWKRGYLLAVTLFILYVLWASAAHSPFTYVYQAFPRLYDFRQTSRQMGLAMPFAALLAAFGVDGALWLCKQAVRLVAVRAAAAPTFAGNALGLAAVAVYGWFAVGDVFETNQEHYGFARTNPVHRDIGAWLKSDEDRPFLFELPDGAGGVPLPFQQDGLKKSRPSWGWRLKGMEATVGPDTRRTLLLPAPRYLVTLGTRPERDDARLVAIKQDRLIWRLEDAPPYAGFVRLSEASEHPEAFEAPPPGGWAPWPFQDVATAYGRWPSVNQVEVRGAPGPWHDTLLVLESYVPGWRLEVDGRRVGRVRNIGGLIAADALPGAHTYLFVFDPAYARRGVAITLATIAAALAALLWRPALVPLARRGRNAIESRLRKPGEEPEE